MLDKVLKVTESGVYKKVSTLWYSVVSILAYLMISSAS